MQNFKSTTTSDAADALGDLNINEEDLEDDDDLMNDSEETRSKTRGTTRHKSKYMKILQDVADRTTSHISIDLDDLNTVSIARHVLRRVAERT